MSSFDQNGSLRRAAPLMEMATWVNSFGPWEVISHMTFKWEASLPSTVRCFEKFMQRHLSTVTYFYAVEENPSREGHHVHALFRDFAGILRKDVWHQWFSKYGRARIEAVNNHGDVVNYCAKYVCKERSWWNIRVVNSGLWHRVQAAASSLEAPQAGNPGSK